MESGRLGGSMVRGPGEVPVYGHGPLFFLPSPKKWGPKVLRSLKAIMSQPLRFFGAEAEWQDPHFARLLRFSEGSSGIFYVLETPPGTLRRVLGPPNTAGPAAPVSGR